MLIDERTPYHLAATGSGENEIGAPSKNGVAALSPFLN